MKKYVYIAGGLYLAIGAYMAYKNNNPGAPFTTTAFNFLAWPATLIKM